MSWFDKRVQRFHKYPGRKAAGLGQTPRIHLEKQKDLSARKGEEKIKAAARV